MYNLDRTRLYGRELEVEFARGDRKSTCCQLCDVKMSMTELIRRGAPDPECSDPPSNPDRKILDSDLDRIHMLCVLLDPDWIWICDH